MEPLKKDLSIRTVQHSNMNEWKVVLHCASRVSSALRNVHIRCPFLYVPEVDKRMQKLTTNWSFRVKSLVIKGGDCRALAICKEEHPLLHTSNEWSECSLPHHRYGGGTYSQHFTCLTEVAFAKYTACRSTERMTIWGHLMFFIFKLWGLPV